MLVWYDTGDIHMVKFEPIINSFMASGPLKPALYSISWLVGSDCVFETQ